MRHELIKDRYFLGHWDAHCSCGQKTYSPSTDWSLIEKDHSTHVEKSQTPKQVFPDWNLRITFDQHTVATQVARESCRLAFTRARGVFVAANVECEGIILRVNDVPADELSNLIQFLDRCAEDYLLHNVELFRRASDIWEAQRQRAVEEGRDSA